MAGGVIGGAEQIAAGAQHTAEHTNWVEVAQRTETHVDFARAVLQELGAPMTDENVYFLAAWMRQENTKARWNPLATNRPMPGSKKFNGSNVQSYDSAAKGVKAWVGTIRDGYFPHILDALMKGDGSASLSDTHEWTTYIGDANYAKTLGEQYQKYIADHGAAGARVGRSVPPGARERRLPAESASPAPAPAPTAPAAAAAPKQQAGLTPAQQALQNDQTLIKQDQAAQRDSRTPVADPPMQLAASQKPLSVNTSIDPRTLVADPNAEKPLGVPIGYVPPRWIEGFGPVQHPPTTGGARAGDDPRNMGPASPQVLPQHKPYYPSDAYNPASTPGDIPELQQKLIKAGLLDPTAPGYTPGLWGANEIQAWLSVLTQANTYGVDANTMLDYKLAHPGANLDAIQQIQLTSPIAVQQAFEAAMKSSLGVKPSPDQTAKFVQAWQGYETSTLTGVATAQAAYKKNPVGAPTSLQGEASPSDFAANYIDQNYAGQEAGVGYEHGLDLITNLIGSTKSAGG